MAAEWMPVVRLFGFAIGLSPLLQWLVLPAAAFAIAPGLAIQHNGGSP